MPTIKVNVNTFGREMHDMFFLVDGKEVHTGRETAFALEVPPGRHEFEVYVDCWHGGSNGSRDRFFARSDAIRVSVANIPMTWSVDVGAIKLYIWGASGALVTAMRRLFGAKLIWPPNRATWPTLIDQRIDLDAKRSEGSEVPQPLRSPSTFDVFISHASEDKDLVVRPLAEELRRAGMRVWYDEFELRIGDSRRRRIDDGLAKSRFGIIVLSPSSFAKGWTQYELDGLVSGSNSGKQNLLPIWHGVGQAEVAAFSLPLSDKVALSTLTHSITAISEDIIFVIGPSRQ